jgi:putative flippase GtrA
MSLRSAAAYTSVVAASFGVNLLTLYLFLRLSEPFLAQFMAIGSYVFISYILHSRLAFPVHARAREDSARITDKG